MSDENNLPTDISLHQNYPNPFNPSTEISYQSSEVGFVKLKVYDILGREIATLVDEYKQAGFYNSQFKILNYHPAFTFTHSKPVRISRTEK